MRVSRLSAVALLLVVGARAVAAEPARRQLYTKRAPLLVDGAGLTRLSLPAEVLAACRPDAADLLILDDQGMEIPYALDSGVKLGDVREVVETAPAQVLDTLRGETSDVRGDAHFLERYEVARPAAAPGTTQLLLVEAGRRGSLEVEAAISAGRARVWSPPPIELSVAETGAWGHSIDLPAALGDRITVTLRGRDPRAAPPVILFRSVRVQEQERVRLELESSARKSERGVTRVDLARPAGWRIDALEVETTTPAYSRRVTVSDVRMHGGETVVARASLVRVRDAATPVGELISLGPLAGDHLQVSIRDGDSPPLADLRFFAVVRRPALIFATRRVRDGRAGTLLFGGGRVRRPHYDLQSILSGGDAQARAGMYDAAALRVAHLGPVEANPAFDGKPLLHFAMRPGAALDAGAFRYRRRLDVRPSPEGLSRLPLQAADLARARPDLADVRVVDAHNRQWPLLLRRDESDAWARAEWHLEKGEAGQSRILLAPPVVPLPVDRLTLQVVTAYFQRPFELLAFDTSEQTHTLLRGTLRSDVDETGPVDIAFPTTRLTRLELIVEDGDDAPLRLDGARVRFMQPAAFFVAEPGVYWLLLGNPEAEMPRYDLAAIRDVVFSVASEDAIAGELVENADYVPPAQRNRAALWWKRARRFLVWAVLVGAVAVLALLTLRQIRDGAGHET